MITPHETLGAPRLDAGPPAVLRLTLPQLPNEHREPMRLLAAWLCDEGEGAIFYSGSGGTLDVSVPPGARGYRLRRWPSEGLAPEYLDWWFNSGQPSAVSGQHEEARRHDDNP